MCIRDSSRLTDARKRLTDAEMGRNNATHHKHTALSSAKESIEDLQKAKDWREASARNCTDHVNVAEAKQAALKSETKYQEEGQNAEIDGLSDRLGIENAQRKQSFITSARKELEAQLAEMRDKTAKLVAQIRAETDSQLTVLHQKQVNLAAADKEQLVKQETTVARNASAEEHAALVTKLAKVQRAEKQRDEALHEASALREQIRAHKEKVQAEQQAMQSAETAHTKLEAWSDQHLNNLAKISGVSLEDAEEQRATWLEHEATAEPVAEVSDVPTIHVAVGHTVDETQQQRTQKRESAAEDGADGEEDEEVDDDEPSLDARALVVDKAL
eukprot:TRINITY_DN3801_c0_g1_i4.p1 TRINITY_DN3801_c0_g1~~TRINITY_DN3801_c0_g1_i4.p1  ORF type:complete len:330 (-),score=110.00 TRINITY_DN3801_c0_g1_i4:287-1276(-)